MKYSKYLMILFYMASFFGLVIQSIPSLQKMFNENVFEVTNVSSETLGFHFPPNKDLTTPIKIEYGGDLYHGIFIERFSLTNNTGRSVKREDFDSGIKLAIKNSNQVKILSLETMDAKGEKRTIEINQDDDVITLFPPHLINDGESLYVDIISSESPVAADFEGRIAGVDDFVMVSNLDWRFYFSWGIFITSLFVMIFSSFVMGISTAEKIRSISFNFSLLILISGMAGTLGGIAMYGGMFFELFKYEYREYYYMGSMLSFLPYLATRIYFSYGGEERFFLWLFKEKVSNIEESQ